MKFTKYNNPNKRRKPRHSPYSREYVEARRREMEELLATAKTDAQREIIIQAYNISVNP